MTSSLQTELSSPPSSEEEVACWRLWDRMDLASDSSSLPVKLITSGGVEGSALTRSRPSNAAEKDLGGGAYSIRPLCALLMVAWTVLRGAVFSTVESGASLSTSGLRSRGMGFTIGVEVAPGREAEDSFLSLEPSREPLGV